MANTEQMLTRELRQAEARVTRLKTALAAYRGDSENLKGGFSEHALTRIADAQRLRHARARNDQATIQTLEKKYPEWARS